MEVVIKAVAQYVALTGEAIAVALIVSGMVGALLIYARKTYFVKRDYPTFVESRNHLGHSLSLSLEFLIGADIIKTAISPSWQDIGQLAAIVGIRTFLNFFLTKELKAGG